ncbi:photosystem I assembly factor PSA3, chloroplastic [Mercurialis annua]|uniref:photosystem I assembly factor PSA3, chloroplastic n=1 Tax=Mercurialis annua TaxID=3986 RepID=UPI00215F0964|nr:photosystem I assembly factor PSA3, chloroplastic [Mercurialis annua]
MVVVTALPQTLTSCNSISPILKHFHQFYTNYKVPTNPKLHSSNGYLSISAYMEEPNSIANLANKIVGSLPVVGLFARIFSDEGGVGGDTIDFAEFRRRVGKQCTINESSAFYEFQDRRGKAGDPLYVLLCCWLAATGAGLLKSEEILEGVARLRLSDDIEFEEQNFIQAMNEAKKKRAKLNVAAPTIPMVARAQKALEAIHICCFGKDLIEKEDERLLFQMLCAVFPSVEQPEIKRMVEDKAKKVAEGTDEINVPEPRNLPKDAAKMQRKDLEFLQQNRDT